jgi:hypothetical protein
MRGGQKILSCPLAHLASIPYNLINRSKTKGMIQMLKEAMIKEFGIEFNDGDLEVRFDKLIKNAMGMIENARELINDDTLMYLIINPIALSISHTIAIMLDNDDADDLDFVSDKITVMIMDSFAD